MNPDVVRLIEQSQYLLSEAVKLMSRPAPRDPTLPESLDLGKLPWRPSWPRAVDEHRILNPDSDRDRAVRSARILETMLERDIRGARFLDYGCGAGDLAYAACDWGPEMSVGYDPSPTGWSRFPTRYGLKFTDRRDDLEALAPFDVVMLHDVLEFAEDPAFVLRDAAELVAVDGLIQVRLIPWSSRVAFRNLNVLNKAYVQLFLTYDEVRTYGGSVPEQRVVTPLEIYREWIGDAGLRIRHEFGWSQKVDKAFSTAAIAKYLDKNWPGARENLGITLVDYVLSRAM